MPGLTGGGSDASIDGGISFSTSLSGPDAIFAAFTPTAIGFSIPTNSDGTPLGYVNLFPLYGKLGHGFSPRTGCLVAVVLRQRHT